MAASHASRRVFAGFPEKPEKWKKRKKPFAARDLLLTTTWIMAHVNHGDLISVSDYLAKSVRTYFGSLPLPCQRVQDSLEGVHSAPPNPACHPKLTEPGRRSLSSACFMRPLNCASALSMEHMKLPLSREEGSVTRKNRAGCESGAGGSDGDCRTLCSHEA